MSTLSQAALRNTTSVTKNVSSKLLGSTRTMASGKEIRFGVEGRAAMLRGVDLLADAVQVSFETLVIYASWRFDHILCSKDIFLSYLSPQLKILHSNYTLSGNPRPKGT